MAYRFDAGKDAVHRRKAQVDREARPARLWCAQDPANRQRSMGMLISVAVPGSGMGVRLAAAENMGALGLV